MAPRKVREPWDQAGSSVVSMRFGCASRQTVSTPAPECRPWRPQRTRARGGTRSVQSWSVEYGEQLAHCPGIRFGGRHDPVPDRLSEADDSDLAETGIEDDCMRVVDGFDPIATWTISARSGEETGWNDGTGDCIADSEDAVSNPAARPMSGAIRVFMTVSLGSCGWRGRQSPPHLEVHQANIAKDEPVSSKPLIKKGNSRGQPLGKTTHPGATGRNERSG